MAIKTNKELYEEFKKFSDEFQETHKLHNLAPHHYSKTELHELMNNIIPILKEVKKRRKEELQNNKNAFHLINPYIRGMYEGYIINPVRINSIIPLEISILLCSVNFNVNFYVKA